MRLHEVVKFALENINEVDGIRCEHHPYGKLLRISGELEIPLCVSDIVASNWEIVIKGYLFKTLVGARASLKNEAIYVTNIASEPDPLVGSIEEQEQLHGI